jgi:hypothetical protein
MYASGESVGVSVALSAEGIEQRRMARSFAAASFAIAFVRNRKVERGRLHREKSDFLR